MPSRAAAALLLALPWASLAAQRVSVDNYLRAESHTYMGTFALMGALGSFYHAREVTSVDASPASAPQHGQPVIRMNRDTLYSALILDLAAPATLTFPEVGDRFVSAQFLSETHDVFPCKYEPGRYRFTQNNCGCEPPCRTEASGVTCTAFGTPYAFVLVRTLADAANASDMAEAHRAQDGFAVEQADRGKWDVPRWSQWDLAAIRRNLLELRATSTAPPTFGFFTGPERIDRLYGMMSVAAGWGGVRPEDQFYTPFVPPAGSSGNFTLTMPQVPVEGNGFWSVTVYNLQGFMFANPSNYNSAAQGARGLNPDGSTTVRFGGCEDPARQVPSSAHCLPIQPGWHMVLRLFRPAPAVLDGSWRAPEPVAEGAGAGPGPGPAV